MDLKEDIWIKIDKYHKVWDLLRDDLRPEEHKKRYKEIDELKKKLDGKQSVIVSSLKKENPDKYQINRTAE